MPDGVRQPGRSLAGCPGDFTPPGAHLPSRQGRPSSRGGRDGMFQPGSPVARPHLVLRIFSRRQWRWHWRQPPNRVDRFGRQTDRAERRVTMNFTDKIALVAGGTGALGRAVTLQFLDAGATVAVTYRKQPEFDALVAAAAQNALRLTG